MATVSTSTSSTATAYSNQRKAARFSNGVLFATFHDGSNWVCRYSSDNGQNWSTPGTGGSIGSTYTNGSAYIDTDDYIHLVVANSGGVQYLRGTPDTGRTSYTWSSPVQLEPSGNASYPDVVAHAEGTGWRAHCVWSLADSTPANSPRYAVVTITSGGSISASSITQLGGSYGVNAHLYPSICIDTSKNLYVTWSTGATGTGNGVRFKKATYSAGPTWTWGSEEAVTESLFATGGGMGPCAIDSNGGVYVAWWEGSITGRLYYRASAGGWSSVAGISTTIAPTIAMHSNRAYVFVQNSGLRYVTAEGGVFGTGGDIDTGDTSANWLAARRDSSGSALDVLYTTGSGSPYNVKHHRITLVVNVTVESTGSPAQAASLVSNVSTSASVTSVVSGASAAGTPTSVEVNVTHVTVRSAAQGALAGNASATTSTEQNISIQSVTGGASATQPVGAVTTEINVSVQSVTPGASGRVTTPAVSGFVEFTITMTSSVVGTAIVKSSVETQIRASVVPVEVVRE